MIPPGLETFKPIDRWTLLSNTVKSITLPGEFAEFGVYMGKTARHILRDMPTDRKLYLFDSFLGLPEDWHWMEDATLKKGHFNLRGKSPVIRDKRVEIVKGWFEDTVAKWAKNQQPLAFVHIDCDLYSSCKTVLTGIRHLLVPGTVIQFDEIQGFQNYAEGEYKAWIETGLKYEWLGRSEQFRAALKVC